ncbi:MAG TPA: threonine/serine dehydratase [Gaiellaceae bacterium]|nr:threonine/serine dehydratase [Gaiellaceae bacterium]
MAEMQLRTPTREDVLAARATIAGRVHRTPTVGSTTLGRRIGARAFLKAELFQKTGSFKPRGVLNKLASLTPEERARGVVTWSAGNHAQAVAWASAGEGIDCLVVMAAGANPQKVAATRGYGAAVDLEAPDQAAAHERLNRLIEETGRTYIPPFDDPHVIAGQGTVGLEIAEDVPEADLIVCPIGGGGLIAGIATATDTRLVGVEPELSAAFTAGLAAGKSVHIDLQPTTADGLAPPFAGELNLAIGRERVEEVVLVTEDEIAAGMRFLYARAKLACEPSGAAATAALLAGKIRLEPGSTVVAVVSGGNSAGKVASAILAAADES